MDKPPERIYLQLYDEGGNPLNLYDDLATWSTVRFNESDVAYVIDKPDTDPPKAILCFEGEEIELR